MKHLLSTITLLLLSTLAFGQVPNTFSSGETISSSKINANFSFLADAMASGNVTAMMHCMGKTLLIDETQPNIANGVNFVSPKIAYNECLSTDNTTFKDTQTGCPLGYVDVYSGNFQCSWGQLSSGFLLITSDELLTNNWILIQKTVTDSGETNVFYKVSSD